MLCKEYFPRFTTTNNPSCETCEYNSILGCRNKKVMERINAHTKIIYVKK